MGPGIPTGITGVDPRFLERLIRGKRLPRWLPPSSRHTLAAVDSIAQFANAILDRLEPPGILHRTHAVAGRPLIAPLASPELEDQVSQSVPQPSASSFFVERAFDPVVAVGPPELRPTAEVSLEPASPLPGPAASEGRPATTVSPGSAIGRLNRSLLQASQPPPLESWPAEPSAPSVSRPTSASELATGSAIRRLNRSLLQASQPTPLGSSPAEPPARRGSPRPRSRGVGPATQPSNPAGDVVAPSIADATLARSALTPLDRLLNQARQSSPRVLNESTRAPLATYLELDAGRATFYDNPAADEVNRRIGSDALSVGDQVFFRQGRFAPDDPRGLALIGHELTHVDSSRDDVLTRRPATPASPAEEGRAVANEMRVLHEAGISARPAPVALENPSPAAATGFKTAEGDRFEEIGDAQADSDGLSEVQLTKLRDMLYHDLRERLRIDHERGA
jgi:Domain of unknown function (DUF4157)